MSKKIKTVFALGDDFKVMIELVPRLEAFIKGHREIAAGYQKYRKNGGTAIPGVEKYLGVKEQAGTSSLKTAEKGKTKKVKAPEKSTGAKKAKKL